MKRIICILLSAVLCCLALSACGNTTDENLFTKSVYDTANSIKETFDFDDALFYDDTYEYALDAIMFQYGIEDEAVLNSIDKYAFTVPGTNSAKTFALITFKEGTSAETIDAAEKAIKDVYIANLINSTAMYDMEQSEVADKATFVKYDNALLLVAYDSAGNNDVINAVNAAE